VKNQIRAHYKTLTYDRRDRTVLYSDELYIKLYSVRIWYRIFGMNNLAKQVVNQTSMKPTQLFLLEGQTDFQKPLKQQLGKGFKLVEFDLPELLVEASRNSPPDLIIILHEPPFVNGIRLLEQLKGAKSCAHVPVILIVPNPDFQDKMMAYSLGVDGIIDSVENHDLVSVLVSGILKSRAALSEYTHRKYLLPELYKELKSEDDHFIAKINSFIKYHLSDIGLNVQDIANHMALSCSQLDRKVQKLTGYSPKNYIREFRLQVARQLLKENKGNVTEIAALTGFKSISYFCIRFKARFGVNASNLRSKG
jgi:AraC-like DNA-binding protein